MVAALRFQMPTMPVPSVIRLVRRRLGEQHGDVVRPRLRQEEAVVAEAIALGGETDDRFVSCLQRHDGKTDSWAHTVSSCSQRTRAELRLTVVYA